jgi:hypothetical protein
MEALEQDAIRGKKQWEQREVDKELEIFREHVLGHVDVLQRSSNNMLNRR